MITIKRGLLRTVLLTERYAIKLPTGSSWAFFLNGLLSNMGESRRWRDASAAKRKRMCPVLWAIPGGFMVVMQRAEPIPDVMWESEGRRMHRTCRKAVPFVECKPCSFGLIDGNYVAVDYG